MIKLFLVLLLPLYLSSQVLDPYIHVHFHPHVLNPGDSLRDGEYGDRLLISDRTFLIWVDMDPRSESAHLRIYILIADQDIRLWKGHRRPYLNGKELFDMPDSRYAVISPIEIGSVQHNRSLEHRIKIHIHPIPLHADDVLTDGAFEKSMLLEDDTLLIWVDMLPEAFFTHPTAYILISRGGTRMEKGGWWPQLNGKSILYGEVNAVGILSPFRLRAARRR